MLVCPQPSTVLSTRTRNAKETVSSPGDIKMQKEAKGVNEEQQQQHIKTNNNNNNNNNNNFAVTRNT